MTVTVVIVSYHSADVLPDCLRSLPSDIEIIVVSQDGGNDTEAVTHRERPDATLIASGRNRGFGAGCNLGAANASGDTVIFLNPDTRVLGDCLARLAETSRANGGTLTGPRIVDDTGRDVTRARHWSSPWTDVVDLLVPISVQPRRWRRDIPADCAVYRDGGTVPYVQGACMAIGRARFLELGGFDEAFFLYGEEEYLARRLYHDGQRAILDVCASIAHTQHTSLTKTRRFAVEQYFRTRALVYRRDISQRDMGLLPGLIRSLPLATALLLLIVSSPLRKLCHYRGAEDRTWCAAALRGLWHGLHRHLVSGPAPAET
jgi:N-acetylglucosaminyl-diphospho-decaprenol L-rhamnosyltransferase